MSGVGHSSSTSFCTVDVSSVVGLQDVKSKTVSLWSYINTRVSYFVACVLLIC